MVDKVEILVEELSSTTGTGNFTLAAKLARRSFNAGYGLGGTDKFYYFILHKTLDEYEFGTGHMLDATTLVRDTVISSSNADTLVSFGAGTKEVNSDFFMPEGVAGQIWVANGIGNQATFQTVVPASVVTEVFTSPGDYVAGADTDITLSITPVSESFVWATFKGMPQHGTEFSLAGNVLSFSPVIPASVTVIEVKIFVPGTIGAAGSARFESPVPFPIVSAGQIIEPHGLGVRPFNYFVELINIIPEHNYTVGQRTKPSEFQGSVAGIGKGLQLVPDATNLVGRYGNDTNVFNVIDAANGDEVEATNANWEAIIKAEK